MGLEVATNFNELNPLFPLATDARSEGDDHLRMLKVCAQTVFPGLAGRFGRVQAKAAAYNLAATDNQTTLNCTAGLTISGLAVATAGNGFAFWIYANGGAVVFDPSGAELVNGAASVTVADGHLAYVVCTGTAWFLVSFANTGGNAANVFAVGTPTADSHAMNHAQFVDGWISDFATWTCTTAGVAGSLNADGSQNVAPVAAQFTVPGDQTATFGKGLKLKFTQTSVKYGYVKSSSHAAGTTTVTLMENMDYQMVIAAITLNKFSFGAPGDFPKEFAYLNPFIPTTGAPTTIVPLGKFTMFGGQVRAHMDTTLTNIGTCVSYLFSLPIAALNSNVNGSGNEIAAAGHMVSIRPYTTNSALVYPFKYDGTFLITNGYRIAASVVYTHV